MRKQASGEPVNLSRKWAVPAASTTLEEFIRAPRHDQRRALRRFFTGSDLRAAIRSFSRVLPDLNSTICRKLDLRSLADMASAAGAGVKVFGSVPEGLGPSLRGFYLHEGVGSGKSTIYLNRDHHPVAIAATFFHELGHHLFRSRVERLPEPVILNFGAEFDRHLEEPFELLADIFAALMAYPRPVAARLFDGPGRRRSAAANAANASIHLHTEHGINLSQPTNLRYLTGLIHYSQLRTALLKEYRL